MLEFGIHDWSLVALTNELLALLKSSAPSRIINLGSGTHRSGKMNFDDLQSEKNYNAMNAYANAKLMVTTYTYELARRLEGTGVTVNVVEPTLEAIAAAVSTTSGFKSCDPSKSVQREVLKPLYTWHLRIRSKASLGSASQDCEKPLRLRCLTMRKCKGVYGMRQKNCLGRPDALESKHFSNSIHARDIGVHRACLTASIHHRSSYIPVFNSLTCPFRADLIHSRRYC